VIKNKSKIYFAQYGMVVSMDKQDALSLCRDAIAGKPWNLLDYKSSKQLRRPEIRRGEGFYQNGVYVSVNHALDWEEYEWQNLYNELTTLPVKKNPYYISKYHKLNAKDRYGLGIIEINPTAFLRLTTPNDSFILRLSEKVATFEEYDNHHKDDSDLFPYLRVMLDGQVTGHEGRHRAIAAINANEPFHCFVIPDSDDLTYRIKEDILGGNGLKYIPSDLKSEFRKFYETNDFRKIKI
jgi:hypothetical protein